MTSKVQPAENYWTDDVEMTSKVLLNRSPRKPGDKVVLFWWAETQKSEMAKLLQEWGNVLNE